MVEWDSLAPGGVALYTCVPGFILMGELIRICGSDGTWSGVPSTCERKKCICTISLSPYTVFKHSL